MHMCVCVYLCISIYILVTVYSFASVTYLRTYADILGFSERLVRAVVWVMQPFMGWMVLKLRRTGSCRVVGFWKALYPKP